MDKHTYIHTYWEKDKRFRKLKYWLIYIYTLPFQYKDEM